MRSPPKRIKSLVSCIRNRLSKHDGNVRNRNNEMKSDSTSGSASIDQDQGSLLQQQDDEENDSMIVLSRGSLGKGSFETDGVVHVERQGGDETRATDSVPSQDNSHAVPCPSPDDAEEGAIHRNTMMISTTAFTARDVDADSPVSGKLAVQHSGYFEDASNIHHLNQGGVIFGFSCHHSLGPFEADVVRTIANLSSFQDETVENFVPHIGEDMSEIMNQYTPVLVKAAYILPFVSLDEICDPVALASTEYQRTNQPYGTRIWEEDWLDDTTFRMTRAVIPYVYNITIQFKVSRIDDPVVLSRLSDLVGTRVDCGLLLERTKHSVPPKLDRTRKAKSVLLYTAVDGGGVLVNHITVILQSSLPSIVEGVIDSFGGWGLAEACETTRKTRKYLLNKRQRHDVKK